VTSVRVLSERALTLRVGEGSVLHLAGEELELPDDEAAELVSQGFVAVATVAAERRRGRSGDDEALP